MASELLRSHSTYSILASFGRVEQAWSVSCYNYNTASFMGVEKAWLVSGYNYNTALLQALLVNCYYQITALQQALWVLDKHVQDLL